MNAADAAAMPLQTVGGFIYPADDAVDVTTFDGGSMRIEVEINTDAQVILDRLESALERARGGLAIVDAADLAAAIEALRGVLGDVVDRHRVKI